MFVFIFISGMNKVHFKALGTIEDVMDKIKRTTDIHKIIIKKELL